MADFDVSIIAKLIDEVSAQSKVVTDSLQRISNAAKAAQTTQAQAASAASGGWLAFARDFRRGFVDEMMNGMNGLNAGFAAGWGNLVSGATRAYHSITGVLSSLWAAIRRIGILTGISLGGVGYAIHNWAQAQQQQAMLAQSLGMSTQRLKQWEAAANAANIPLGQLHTGLEMFMNNLEQARQGTGAMYEALSKERSGAGRELLAGMLAAPDTESAFAYMMDFMKGRYADAAVPIMRAMMGRFMGAAGYRLAQENIPAIFGKVEELWPAPTAAQQAKLDNYNRALNQMSTAWQGIKGAAMLPFLDVFAAQYDRLQKWMGDPKNREWVSKESGIAAGKLRDLIEYIFPPEGKKGMDWEGWGKSFRRWVLDPLNSVKDLVGGWMNLGMILSALYLGGPIMQGLYGLVQIMMALSSPALLLGLGAFAAVALNIYQNWDKVSPVWQRLKGHGDDLFRTIKDLTGTKAMNWKELFLGTGAEDAIELLESIDRLLKGIGNFIDNYQKGGLAKAVNEAAGRTLLAEGPKDMAESDRIAQEAMERRRRLFANEVYGPGSKQFYERLNAAAALPTGTPMRTGGRPAVTGESPSLMPDWLNYLGRELLFGRAQASERPGGGMMPRSSVVPTPFLMPTAPWTPESVSNLFGMASPGALGGGMAAVSALRTALSDVVGHAPAALAANAPIGGMPPTGITIQARGPNVEITQAPPSINIAVTVNVMKPDEAPIATATAIGDALAGERGPLNDYGTQ